MNPRALLLSLTDATRATMRTARKHLLGIANPGAEQALRAVQRVIAFNTDIETTTTEDDTKCLLHSVSEIRNALLPVRCGLQGIAEDPNVAAALKAIQQLLDFTTECANELHS